MVHILRSFVFVVAVLKIIVVSVSRCTEDSVFLDQEALREEYVLNDSGRIWMGSVKKQFGMPWNFGQVRPEWCSRKWACAIDNTMQDEIGLI